MSALEEISWKRIVRDGSIFSLIIGAIIGGSAYLNPEIWHDDYPPDIKERFGPMSETAKQQRLVVAVPFLGTLIGAPIYSTLRLKAENGGTLSFAAAFLNTYGFFMFFNIFDLVVMDYGIFVKLHPSWSVLPGTEDMTESYRNVAFHVNGFFKGTIGGILPCLLIAWLISRSK